MTPTYQIVARSRSFLAAKIHGNSFSNSNDNNNINNAMNKGYKTLPNRSTRTKISRPRKTSDHTQVVGGGESTKDYDVPPERDDDEVPQILNFPNDNVILEE
ncbi:hypothetical protein RRG08_011475 [Elysia crispata]|uniref:Uncharacterized protein n=1 Tax=Elysia crispata TaxID=231223 RepID=A0AAE1EAB8_9GAST|nr:hypothetical protein RRG08_011475 [Elysia crispata]